jgi:hypothetical protein
MFSPVRIRLSRAKGFNLQETSLKLNGLPAVNVARPGRWGNPFKIAPAFESEGVKFPAITRDSAVVLHREWLERSVQTWPEVLADLRGKNLACWCGPDEPCHADTLLDLANRPQCREVA